MADPSTQREAPPWLRPLVDYAPLVVFFAIYVLTGDLMQATAAIIVAALLAVGLAAYVERRIPKMPLFSAGAIAFLGGLTLLLNDETFFKMKPTVVQLIFAAILAFGLLTKRPLLKYILGKSWPMDEQGWHRLSLRFALFFLAMAVLNEAVWRTQTTDFWVTFKVFGLSGLTFAFALCQVPLLRRHALASEGSESPPPG